MDKLETLYQKWQLLQPLTERKSYLLSQRFAVDYNFNSNHLEGNTLTYGQTELLLLFGKVSGEGELHFFNEMKASQVGVEMMTEAAKLKAQPLTQNFIRQLHQTLLREDYKVHYTLPNGATASYTVHAGRYKTRPNSVITRYGDHFEYASPEETPTLMSDLVDWYNQAEQSGEYTPVELAALFHYRYIRIHPFEDGNGRIARLMVNYILARHDWPMIVVRSRNKQKYLDALHNSDVEVGPSPSDGAKASLRATKHFVRYFKEMVAEELKYAIAFAEETSAKVWWYDGRKVTFRAPSTPKLLQAMKDDPTITIAQLAQIAGISVAATNKQLRQLQSNYYIDHSGQDGAWRVFACQSI